MIQSTSILAYSDMKEQLSELEGLVYEAIEALHATLNRWPTNREIQQYLNAQNSDRHWSTADVSARRNGLINSGIVVPDEQVTCSKSGKRVLTWAFRYKQPAPVVDKHGQSIMNF